MLDDYCLRVFGDIVPEQNRFREIVSGETIAARPEIQKVLRLIENDRYKAILIIEPQRLSRGDLEDIGRLSKLLRYTHTIVITLQYSYDLTDERDRDYFERELKRGNEYLEYSKRIMRNGIHLSVERGDYVASFAPYGYRIIKCKDGKRSYHTLEIVPEQASIVRMIFEMYANGIGATTIAHTLNDSGITPPRAASWKPTTVYMILDNPHYIGKVKWNTRKQTVIVVNGDIRKTRPRQQPELFDGKHPPIIDTDLWNSVREKRTDRHIPKVRSSFDLQNPLAGLMRCECGALIVQTSPAHRQKRLYCRNQKNCGNAGCTTSVVLQMIADALRDQLHNISVSESKMPALPQHIVTLKKQVEALQAKQDALWEKLAEGMPRDTFDRLLQKNNSEIESTQSAIAAAEANYAESKRRSMLSTNLHAAIEAITSPETPPEASNLLLKACISRIIYKRHPATKSLSGGNRGGWITYEPELTIELKL